MTKDALTKVTAAALLRDHLDHKPFMSAALKAALAMAIDCMENPMVFVPSDAQCAAKGVTLGYEIMGNNLYFGDMRPDGAKLNDIWYSVDMTDYKDEARESVITRANYLAKLNNNPEYASEEQKTATVAKDIKILHLINLLGDIIECATNRPAQLTAFNSPLLQLAVVEVFEHNHPDQADEKSKQIFRQMALVGYNG